jgi:hypothetical protein
MKYALLALSAAVLAGPVLASSVRIDNETGGWDIYEVYISPAGSDSWGENLLGSGTIAPDGTGEFTVDPGLYDLMLVDEDGDMYEKYGVHILFRMVWTVTLDDLTRYASGAVYSGG